MMNICFAPGPINLPEVIKRELLVEPPYFGGSDFHDIIEKIQPQLRELFQTDGSVLLCTGSGSLLMEQTVVNFFSPSNKIVVINSGRYGQNWIDCARAYGLFVKEIKADLSPDRGLVVPIEEIDDWLRRHPDTEGVFCQHVETTTGIKNSVGLISKSVRKHTNALFIVDAISSFLSEDLSVEDWEIDVALVSSQKGLSLPPGLGLMSISTKAKLAAETSRLPKFYFNVLTELDRQIGKHQTRFTPATQLIMCLSKFLDILETVDYSAFDILKRAHQYSQLLSVSLFGNGLLTPYSNTINNTITVGLLPGDVSTNLFFRVMEERYGYVLGRGTELIKDKGVRIRTFGWDLQYADVVGLIETIKIAIAEIRASDNGTKLTLEKR